MALTHCPDCNRRVSDQAHACVGCGRPIAMAGGEAKIQPPDTVGPGATGGTHTPLIVIGWLLTAASCVGLLVALAMFCIGFDGDRVSLMFGLWSSETDVFNVLSTLGRTRVVGLLIHGVLDLFLGWIGVTLVLIATAGIFPAMMESGGIEVLLGKPISRHGQDSILQARPF